MIYNIHDASNNSDLVTWRIANTSVLLDCSSVMMLPSTDTVMIAWEKKENPSLENLQIYGTIVRRGNSFHGFEHTPLIHSINEVSRTSDLVIWKSVHASVLLDCSSVNKLIFGASGQL